MLKSLTTIFWFLVALGYGYSATTQPYYFKKYGVENGLSYNSVFAILQDKQDFLWFGTRDGLSRFDGYTFKTFRTDPTQKNSIGNNFIYSLYQGNDDKIWVGTQNGLYQYDPNTESFTLAEGTLGRGIRDVKMDQKGNLWYIADFTLCMRNKQGGKVITYDPAVYFPATAIAFTADDQLWVAANNGYLHHFDAEKNTFEPYYLFEGISPTITRRIERLKFSSKYGLIVSTAGNGAKLFDIQSRRYKNLTVTTNKDTEIYARDAVLRTADECWLATETGIYIYHLNTDKYEHVKKETSDPLSLNDNAIHALFVDQEGGVWIGTYFGGLNYFSPQQSRFEKFYPTTNTRSLGGHVVCEIKQGAKGILWVGTEDAGLYTFDPTTGIFQRFGAQLPVNLPSSNIHGLLVRPQELWVGTYEHGLVVVDLKNHQIKRHYLAGSSGFNSNFIVTICETKAGDILVGTSIGLYRYHPDRDIFTYVAGVPQDVFVSCIVETQNGGLWVGTRNAGLFQLDAKKIEVMGHYAVERAAPNALISNIITAICETRNQVLWVATENGGISSYNSQTKSFTPFRTDELLPSNFIFSIQEDEEDHLWITTANGLVKLAPYINQKVTVYTAKNGLLNDQFNYNSGFKDQEGQLYFGGVKGMIRFHPSTLSEPQISHQLYITGFQVFNKELGIGLESPLKQSIIQTKTIELAHDQSTFSIDFAALCYTAPEMTQYQYQMEGLDTGWTHLRANRKVYFTKLAPGDYFFKVKATGHNDIWMAKPTVLHVRILPPFWATKWAWGLYMILIVVLTYIIIRKYHQYLENKNKRRLVLVEMEKERQIALLEKEKEKELYHAKREFFTHITHEIKTPLTLIRAPLEKAKKSVDLQEIKAHLDIVEKNSNHLIHMANQLLDLEKSEATAVQLHFVQTDIEALLNKIYQRFSLEIDDRQLKVSWQIAYKPFYADVDAEALNTIVGNLLSNAIKFAVKHIRIILDTVPDDFFIRIENDGMLIPSDKGERIFDPFFKLESNQNASGTGIGLPLARSLAELHHGRLTFQVVRNMNVFTIFFPLHQKPLFEPVKNQQEDLEEEVYREEEGIQAQSGKPVILLVDDHKDILTFIEKDLSPDFQIIKATNGKQALDILTQQVIHLIISDVMMPVMDGLELCKQVKSAIQYSHIPFIMLTAKDRLSSKIQGLETGADVYIEKPFSVAHLQAQVNSLLLNRDHVRNYFAHSPLAQMKTLAYTKMDEQFLEKIQTIIHEHLDDPGFEVEQLASALYMSRSSLFRKIKSISDLTPNEMITLTRLKEAAALLCQADIKVYEVAEKTGFSSSTVFARVFNKQFGMSPKNYAKKQREIGN